MKKVIFIALITASIILPSFLTPPSPAEKIKAYYIAQFTQLSAALDNLQQSIENGDNETALQQKFSAARLVYKKLELFIEYYFELDAPQFNGLATNFVEEEDPAADHSPQGFQVIETFLYPRYDTQNKKKLLQYTRRLLALSQGLAGNTALFKPDEYMPNAVMDEFYRVLALGITGFDSPLALQSLPEAKASLQSVQFVLQAYAETIAAAGIKNTPYQLDLLARAIAYIDAHPGFDRFDRAAFITGFLNPLCRWLGHVNQQLGYADNPARYAAIKKTSHLFDAASLRLTAYLKDDTGPAAKTALGKKLFYEPLLSANGKRACSGCHLPGKAFTDGLPKALQVDGHSLLPRNTPTLWNAALQKNLFYDSRQRYIDNLIMEVMGNEKEMSGSADKAAAALSRNRRYLQLYQQAFSCTDTIMSGMRVANAIAWYVRTLVSYNARFDRYMRGDKSQLTKKEINGFNLFAGKAKCATCHYIPLFNGSRPPDYYYQESEMIGVPATTDTLHPILDNDPGRYAILPNDFLQHAFRTPGLRNIALTAPYMHNGVYNTLEEVVEFYNKGGGAGMGLSVPNQTLPATPLQLTATEKKELIAFLKTLTDVQGDR
jgi:cytochrome c peroxidase